MTILINSFLLLLVRHLLLLARHLLLVATSTLVIPVRMHCEVVAVGDDDLDRNGKPVPMDRDADYWPFDLQLVMFGLIRPRPFLYFRNALQMSHKHRFVFELF